MKNSSDARRPRPSLGLALALVLTGLAAALPCEAEPPRVDDLQAAERLDTMQAQGILRDAFWAHAYWVRAQSAPNRASHISDLRWALRFDPELQGARFELAFLLLRNRDPEAATHLLNAALRLGSSFPAQQEAAILLLTLGGGVSLLVLVIAGFLAVFRALGPTYHALSERLAFLPREVRPAATILTIVAPFLLTLTLPPTSAVFWFLLLGAAGGWTLYSRWERRVLVWALAGIVLAPWGVSLWTRLLEPSYPSAYSRLLWEAQTSLDPVTAAGLRNIPDDATANHPEHRATLALLARREGDYAAAATHLEAALRERPESWSYANNLGNVRLLGGDSDGALAAYARARQLAPEEPMISVNEAQAWMRKFEYPKAIEALEEARRKGYHFPDAAGFSVDETILVEDTLDAPTIWKTFLHELDSPRVLGWDQATQMSIRILAPLRPFVLSLPLLAALYFVTQTRFLPRIHTCSSCGKTVCRKCHYRVLRQSLCPECHAIRQRLRAPIQRESALASHRRSVRRGSWLVGLVLSAVVPGSGLLLEGNRRASMALLFAWVAWLILMRGTTTVVGPWDEVERAAPWVLAAASVALYVRIIPRDELRADALAQRSA